MRKHICIALIIVLIFTLSACSSKESNESDERFGLILDHIYQSMDRQGNILENLENHYRTQDILNVSHSERFESISGDMVYVAHECYTDLEDSKKITCTVYFIFDGEIIGDQHDGFDAGDVFYVKHIKVMAMYVEGDFEYTRIWVGGPEVITEDYGQYVIQGDVLESLNEVSQVMFTNHRENQNMPQDLIEMMGYGVYEFKEYSVDSIINQLMPNN